MKVLLVDDNATLLKGYARALAAGGFEVDCSSMASEALGQMTRTKYDLIISDIAMPGMSGIELLSEVRMRDLDIPVVVMTGVPSVETAISAIEFGAFRYLRKPVSGDELVATAKRAGLMHGLAKLKREALLIAGVEGKLLGDRASLEARFRAALDQMWMAYQPIVRWPEQTVIAYEALLRSDEPTLSRPLDLVDAAERLDQLTLLGRTIRARVAEDIRTSAPQGVDVFVNLHARDLSDAQLYEGDAPLSAYAGRVVLEITEREPLESLRTIESHVATLRSLGYRLAIDDLGAGYAGLTSLVQLDPEFLKLDMGLVQGLDGSPMKQRIVGSMVALAGELGKTVIAEGIERAEERDTLQRLGCKNLQGYLFARPVRGFVPLRS